LVEGLGPAAAEGEGEEEDGGGDVGIAATEHITQAGEDGSEAEVGEGVGEGDPVYFGEGVEVDADGVESCCNDGGV